MPPPWHDEHDARVREILEQSDAAEFDPTKEGWKQWMKQDRGLKEKTRKNYIRTIDRLERGGVVTGGSQEEFVLTARAHFFHRRDEEEAPATTLKNDLKGIKCYGDYLGIPRTIWPKAPTVKKKFIRLPNPEAIRQLLTGDYREDPVLNELVLTVMRAMFGLGLRPKEALRLKVDHFHPRDHLLMVPPVKASQDGPEPLLVEPEWLCCGKTRPSLLNWVEHHRPKLDPTTDAMFPHFEGGDWPSAEAFYQYIKRPVKKVHPGYWNRLGRKWSVNARLIESKRGGQYDWRGVGKFHRHDPSTSLRDYERSVEVHERMYGDNWITRAFQKIPGSETEPRWGVLDESSPGEYDAPAGI